MYTLIVTAKMNDIDPPGPLHALHYLFGVNLEIFVPWSPSPAIRPF